MPDCLWREHSAADEMAVHIADELAAAIGSGLAGRDAACLALAGGSTPVGAYRELARRRLPWSSVTLLPTDERWVDSEDPLSNFRMLREQFADAVAHGCRILELAHADRPMEDVLAEVDAEVNALPRPFDLVLLGMGTDGHTASLFPDDPNIEGMLTGGGAVVAANPPSQPTRRVSLGPACLADTRQALLAISGPTKRRVLADALSTGEGQAPIARVLDRFDTTIHIHWCP